MTGKGKYVNHRQDYDRIKQELDAKGRRNYDKLDISERLADREN